MLPNDKELRPLCEYIRSNRNVPLLLVCAAGFEDRATFVARLLNEEGATLAGARVIEFPKSGFPEHETNMRAIVAAIDARRPKAPLQRLPVAAAETAWDGLGGAAGRALLDISAMPHETALRLLRSAWKKGIRPDIAYVEADSYYPKKADADDYLQYEDDEIAFEAASRQESAEVMYAGLSSIHTVAGFEGRVLATRPTNLVMFPTYKRFRSAAIVSELEVRTRLFVTGVPERPDLAWRARALEVINFDLIDRGTDEVLRLSTLSAGDTFVALAKRVAAGLLDLRDNVIICPHGSKMQTVGVWWFCETYPDARIVVSQPRTWFPGKYSQGSGRAFALELRVLAGRQRTGGKLRL